MQRAALGAIALLAAAAAGCGSEDTDNATEASAVSSVISTQESSLTVPSPGRLSPGNSSTPTAGSNRPAGRVDRSSWTDGPWPFTVDTATLMCSEGADGQRVTVVADQEMYALNGAAKSQTDLPDFAAIWADDPGTPGLKIDIGPMLNRGLALCGG